MTNLTKLQKEDYQKFFIEEGDPDFSPQRNRAIINRSIRKYENKRRENLKEFHDNTMERSDAIVTYIRAIDRGGVNTRLDKFFTRDELFNLQGREALLKVMEGLTIIRNKKEIQNAEKKFTRKK